jgi:hypothetical protein
MTMEAGNPAADLAPGPARCRRPGEGRQALEGMMTQPITNAQLEALAERFVRFADRECGDYAPFYDRLARGIAGDPDLLTIAAYTRSGQQVPNLLLAAVHYLLLRGVDHALGTFYPSVAHLTAVPPGDPVPAFRAFCRDHRDALIDLMSTGLVQTNEPQRCTVLLPAFVTVARLAGDRPLALIEVGASAGLNLLFDRYSYDYGAGRSAGAPDAPVRFTCELRGAVLPPIHAGMPPVATRLGIDLNPIHADDPQATLWLRALVWPEHPERAAVLQQVLALAQREPPTLMAGDALEVLPQAVAEAPTDATLCVFHIATLAHFPPEARERFRLLIPELARQRDLFWLSSEGAGDPVRRGQHVTILTAFQYGHRTERRLAYSQPHGAWLEWLDSGSNT